MANHYPIRECCDCALFNECDPSNNYYACGYNGMDYNDYLVESALRTQEQEADREFHQSYV